MVARLAQLRASMAMLTWFHPADVPVCFLLINCAHNAKRSVKIVRFCEILNCTALGIVVVCCQHVVNSTGCQWPCLSQAPILHEVHWDNWLPCLNAGMAIANLHCR